MAELDVYEVVCKLIGPIEPVGETHEDTKRLANIKQLTEMLEKLVADLDSVAHNAKREEASMKAIGMHALDFLNELGV